MMIVKDKTRRQEILEASAALFRKKGYSATSMKDIAERVGMEAASLYNHIDSKQDILEALLMNMARLFTEGMAGIDNSTLNSLQKIEKLIGLHVQLTVQYSNPIALITSEWVHLKPPAINEFSQMRDDYERRFMLMLKDCIDSGQFAPVDPKIALFSILSTLRWLYSWYRKNNGISRHELEKQMIHCLINGLKIN